MQKRPLKFYPNSGTRVGPDDVGILADTLRLRTSNSRWRFNPWTGAERALEDVESDPVGLLIVPPGEDCRPFDVAVGLDRCLLHPRYSTKPFCPDCRSESERSNAREALHDAAEREQQVVDCAREAFDKTFGPQPGPADHPLRAVFALAIEQATRGKGVRHGGEATPFLEQPWVHYGKMHGRGFLTGQAAKKLEEAASTRQGEAFITEALGALVYIGMAILKEQGKA